MGSFCSFVLDKMFYDVLVLGLVLCRLIGHSRGQDYDEVGVGQECWSTNGDIHKCSTGLMCGPWSPNGENWDGTTPWYCLFNPGHTEGEACNYDLKVGLRASGLTCCFGRCSSGSCQPPTPNPSCVATPDRYCMRHNISLSEPCGRTAATNYAGVCQKGLFCNNGTNVCETTPIQCSGADVPCWSGSLLGPVEGVQCCDRCEITDLFMDANCSASSTGACGFGESPSGTPCFPPDPTNPIFCCNGAKCDTVPTSPNFMRCP